MLTETKQHLLDNTASELCSLVRKVLDRATQIKGISVVNNLISCWASYVCIATEEYFVRPLESCSIIAF